MARQLFYRIAELEAGSDTTTAGKVKLSFASELPVRRRDKSGEYWEVLSHAAGDANLGLLNRSGVVLQDHDDQLEIGDVVRKSARVGSDKKTRAEINLFDGMWVTRARTDWAGIPVSVGYERLSVLDETTGDDGLPVRRYSWRPYEISLLTVEPADDTVGINRAKRNVKRVCGECEGHGRCRCRAKADDEAEADCERCGGNGRCADCGGDGHYESARGRGVDFLKDASAETVLGELSDEQKKRMKLLLKSDGGEGGTITSTELETKVGEARKKAVTDTETAERNRSSEITVSADKFIEKHGRKNDGKAAEEIRKFAKEAIEKGDAAKDFNLRAMEYVTNAGPEQIDIRDKVPAEDLAHFSLLRAIQGAARESGKTRSIGKPEEKTVEAEIVTEYEKACREAGGDHGLGYTPEGFVIPPHAPFGCAGMTRGQVKTEFRKAQNKYGRNFMRDMQATIFGSGGAVVPTYWLLPVIELLRNKSVLNRIGVRSMAGLTGNVIIPRLEAPSTAYSVAEITAITNSQQVLGQIALQPHRVGARVPYSKQLVFQSSPDIESLIHNDMLQVLALKKDYLGLNGQGANSEPTGIMNTNGIGTITFSATPTYIKMVLFETIIRALNVMGRLAYTSTSATKGSLKTVAEALTGATTIGGAANAIWKSIGGDGEEDGMVNGCQAVDSQQIPNNQVIAGVFDNFIEGIFGGFDVVVDNFTLAANAEIVVNMNLWLDYAARHPQAFVVSTDAGNQ